MNILHISSNYPPEIGGLATSVPPLARELIKKGHNARVLTRDAKDYLSFEVLEGIPVYRSMRVPGYFYNPPIAAFKSLAMGFKARRIIEKEEIEIIHSHDINVSAIAGIVGTKFKDVKKVTKFPGDLAWELLSLTRWKGESPEEFFEKGGHLIGIIESVQRAICNRYDAIIAPSKYMKGTLVKYSGVESSKIHVVYNAIRSHSYSEGDIDKLRKRLLDGSKYSVISACRMVPWKGVEYLIEAFKTLPGDIRLILIGDGPIKEDLQKRSKGLNIKFLNKVPHSQIQKYIQASDVYALPSIYEPSALALLDCLVTQTPIIATNVGGTPEIISDGKTGLLIKDRNPEAIAHSIQRLLSEEELYNKIKDNQKKECKKYLWKNMIDEYIEIYRGVLDK